VIYLYVSLNFYSHFYHRTRQTTLFRSRDLPFPIHGTSPGAPSIQCLHVNSDSGPGAPFRG
jgi:hypothetical protein